MTTQGTVNWDNLGIQAVSFSLSVLKRIADAGVQPYTICVAQAISNSFRMGDAARKEVQKAVESLKSYSGWGGILNFGFGIKSLPRLMNTTEQGTFCLAFLAALADSYSIEYAGEVMFHIVEILDVPEEFKPSMREWTLLSKACAGSLARSTLPLVIGQLMRQCKDPQAREYDPGEPGEPTEMAKVLAAIGDISRGKLERLVVQGGTNVGFAAALALWLLNLTVKIFSPVGEPLYSNVPQGQEAQVSFHIVPHETNPASKKSIQTTSRTLKLLDGRKVITHWYDKYPMFGARLPWDSCLSLGFADEPGCQYLIDHPQIIGRAVGSAARIFEDLSVLPFEQMFKSNEYQQIREVLRRTYETDRKGFRAPPYLQKRSTQGLELITRSMARFPELNNNAFRDAATEAMRSPHPEQNYLACFDDVQGCSSCGSRMLLDQRSSACSCGKSTMTFHRERASKKGTLEAIVNLCQVVANAATIDESLSPSARGLKRFARSRLTPEDENPLGFLLTSSKPNNNDLSLLFAGEQHARRSGEPIAMTSSGVCIFHSSLEQLKLDASCLSDFCVVPGYIEKDGKMYDEIVEERRDLADPQNHTTIGASRHVGQWRMESLLLTISQSELCAKYMLEGCADKVNGKPIICEILPVSIEETATTALELARHKNVHLVCQCSPESMLSPHKRDEVGVIRAIYQSIEVVLLPRSSRRCLLSFLALLTDEYCRCMIQGEFCIGRCLAAAADLEFRPHLEKVVYILTT